MGFDRSLVLPQALDELLVFLPFQFTIGAAGVTSALKGDGFSAVAHTATGKYTLTMVSTPYLAISGHASVDPGSAGETEDIYAQVRVAGSPSIVVRTKTGTANTDPASGDVVHGGVWCKLTDRVQE